ncbi:MAG: SLBB domain-containing protein, partial [Bacteroidetes bacterium]|nr:SLBB domain-containing protein [Bacteroidota bacterium]
MKKFYFLLLLVPCFSLAQGISSDYENIARARAEAQGVNPDALEQRLKDKGIDMESLTLDDISRVQPIVEQEIAAMKAILEGELPSKTYPSPATVDSTRLNKRIEISEIEAFDTKTLVQENDQQEPGVFGKHIFKDGSISTFEVSKDYVPSDAYILGPGDVVTVSIFGRSQADLQFTIKADGFIEPANLPKIYLKGISLGQARDVVRRRLQNFYQFEKGQFALTLTTARTLTIQITGAVERPGTYTISAYNTAFNALMAAGGPSKLGTVRNIQIINGRKVNNLDVYEYLFNPKKQSDYYLQSNDILYVPYTGAIVEVKGSVKQEGIFEMKEHESFSELLQYTGGYVSDALKDEIQLVRKDENGSYVKEFSNDELNALRFQDGDRVIIATQTSDRKDYVEVKGAVNYPGIYGIRDYPYLKELLEKVILKEESRTDIAYLLRIAANGASSVQPFSPEEVLNGEFNISLEAEDVLQILNQRDFTDSTIVKVSGAVRDSGVYFIDSNVTIETLINLSNGLTKDAKKDLAYVYRRYPDGATEVIPVPLTDNSFMFLDGDELRVLSEQTFFDGATINVSGEVKIPLELPYDKSITLAAVIELAGGLTFAGDSAQLVVYRMPFKGARIGQLEERVLALPRDSEFSFQPYDAVIVRRKFGFENQEYVTLRGEFTYPGRYAIKKEETLKDLIRKAGGLTNEAFPEAAEFTRVGKGKIIVSIDKVLSSSLSYDNIPVLSGDEIYVPAKDYTVRIVKANTEAENFSSTTSKDLHVAFIKGKSAKWYVKNLSGGYAEGAKRWNTTVIYANGYARQTKPWRLVGRYPTVKPGSTILVGKKSEKKKKERE